MTMANGPTNENGLRRVLEFLRQSGAPEDDWLITLSQCAAQLRSRATVTRIARECGLTLSGFRSDTTLELYFDLARGELELGYIAKGWDDPGFRIGDAIEVPSGKTVTLVTNAFQIMRICATQGLGISIDETEDGIELALDGVIYSEGFNRETFRKTLDAVGECTRKVRALVDGQWSVSFIPCPDTGLGPPDLDAGASCMRPAQARWPGQSGRAVSWPG